MTIKYNFSVDINELADFWFYEIRVNVIPADTINKIPLEPWQQYQNESISPEKFEQWKKEGRFDKGIALIPGKIWRGQYAGKYLVAIDLDNNKAIDEFCEDELGELKQMTLVEQTSNPEKNAHLFHS